LEDESTTSSDYYLFRGTTHVGNDTIVDHGGSFDTLDLSQTNFRVLYSTVTRSGNSLFIDDGGGGNSVLIINHFRARRIETLKFANGTISAAQAQSMAQEATPSEEASLQESLEERGSGDSGSTPSSNEG
jgi:hypothetical protein